MKTNCFNSTKSFSLVESAHLEKKNVTSEKFCQTTKRCKIMKCPVCSCTLSTALLLNGQEIYS